LKPLLFSRKKMLPDVLSTGKENLLYIWWLCLFHTLLDTWMLSWKSGRISRFRPAPDIRCIAIFELSKCKSVNLYYFLDEMHKKKLFQNYKTYRGFIILPGQKCDITSSLSFLQHRLWLLNTVHTLLSVQ
jgi:hypothetical protein